MQKRPFTVMLRRFTVVCFDGPGCYNGLPEAALICSTAGYGFIGCKIVIFAASLLDTIIPIVIWGPPFKPNILSCLAVITTIVGTFLFDEVHIVLICESAALLVAWIFMLHFVCKPKFD